MRTNGPHWQTDIRTNWQKCPIAVSAQKWSSALDTRNQLAGVPGSTSCSKQFSTSDTHQNQLAGIPRQRLFLLFSCSVVSSSLQPHGLHTRLPCPKLSLVVCTNSCPLKLVMLSIHLTLCLPVLLLPSTFLSISIFSSESALYMKCPKYRSFSFSISSSNVYSGLISFNIDLFDLLAVQGSLKSFLQYHNSKIPAFFMVQSHIHTQLLEKP